MPWRLRLLSGHERLITFRARERPLQHHILCTTGLLTLNSSKTEVVLKGLKQRLPSHINAQLPRITLHYKFSVHLQNIIEQ